MKKTRWLFWLVLLQGLSMKSPAGPADTAWVDSVYRSLTTEQRIAQLMMIRVWACRDSAYEDSISRIVHTFNPGGICIFKGYPVKQALLTNRLQREASNPLLVATDAEWGVGMRMDSAFSFPRQMALGAISDDSLIYWMGRSVARSCLRLGINVNFAPVADINSNPKNPVISFRSFGEQPEPVAGKSILYMKGMQDGGIMAVAKHFPGHGDTETDSHLDLPVIGHSAGRMDSVELYPFKALIHAGVKGVMVGHLYVPCYDTARNTPATLSVNIISELLKKRMGFGGYVITDALDMKGVTKNLMPGEVEIRALLAGNDILLLPQDLEAAIKAIKTAVDSGRISPELIAQKCRRILALKKELKLDHLKPVDPGNLVSDLNTAGDEALRRKMVDQSVTLVKDDLRLIPLTGLDRRKIAVLSAGDTTYNVFQSTLERYMHLTRFNVAPAISGKPSDSLIRRLSSFDIVIIGIHGITSNIAENFGLKDSMLRFIETVSRSTRTIVALFGTPYALSRIKDLRNPEAILVAYQDNEATELVAAEAIMGGTGITGKLPVTASPFRVGSGEERDKCRLEFIRPEEIGLPRESLDIIDSIAECGIQSGAFPGCQILLARDGKVFYEKAFGNPRYKDSANVSITSLYDIASVTKVAATTLAVMKLRSEGKLSLDDSLGKHLAFLRGSNKSRLLIREVMAHQAGLQEWIPFYKTTLVNGKPDPEIYSGEQTAEYPVRVASGMYIRSSYADTIYRRIRNSPLKNDHDPRYSDLGFYLLRLVVEHISGLPFDRYLDQSFYKPMGLQTIGFNPRNRHDLSGIIPTEYDAEFRKQLLWGDVHDPGAAMLGGISGHAGLFSDAFDLAVIMQMLLNEGSYGGKDYLTPAAVKEFTRVQFPEKGNRRGAGFDKPPLFAFPDGPVCPGASPQSFGHSGFTGTYVWADPANRLVYIFLSNRVYPDASNRKLAEMNIRTDIHQAVYDLMKKYRVK